MSRRFPWGVLGIAETRDTAAIRKAYADVLRSLNVDEDIAGYAELRRARDQALWLAAQGARADDGGELGLGDLDDAWDDDADEDADDDGYGWDDGPEAYHPDPLAPTPGPGPAPRLTEEQQRAQAAWNALRDLLYPDDAPSEAAVTHAELDEGLAALSVLTARAEAADLVEHDALDGALAELFASTWPRSAPFVEPANAAFHWLDEAGSLEERPALMFLNQRLKGMRFHEKVQAPDHPLHKAWTELSRPGRARVIDRLRVKRLEIDKLLTGIRARFPELESHLDPQRVASWDRAGALEGNPGGFGPSAVRWVLIAVLIGAALIRVFASIIGSDTAPGDAPPIAQAAEDLQEAEIDLAVADIFGPGVGMAEVRAADPVFADQLRLAFNYTWDKAAPLQLARRKALASAEVADAGNLAVRADLRGMWMAAAQRQSDDVCRQVMAGDFKGLDLALTDKQRDREQALLRQLLEAKLLSHMPKGGETNISIPGWLVADTLKRSGLPEDKLIAALTDPASPDRCKAEIALIAAVRAAPQKVPDEVLKGL